jgi:hypothetical protein
VCVCACVCVCVCVEGGLERERRAREGDPPWRARAHTPRTFSGSSTTNWRKMSSSSGSFTVMLYLQRGLKYVQSYVSLQREREKDKRSGTELRTASIRSSSEHEVHREGRVMAMQRTYQVGSPRLNTGSGSAQPLDGIGALGSALHEEATSRSPTAKNKPHTAIQEWEVAKF